MTSDLTAAQVPMTPNEVLDKITSPIRLHRSKFFSKLFSKFFRSFSKTFRLFRDFENFSRHRSRRDDSFGPKFVEFRAILAIFRPFEDLGVRPDVQRGRNWRCNLFQHAIKPNFWGKFCRQKIWGKFWPMGDPKKFRCSGFAVSFFHYGGGHAPHNEKMRLQTLDT